MKIQKKHIVIGGVTLFAFSLMSFAKAKGKQAKEVFAQIIVRIADVRRFDINFNRIRFYIDVALQNPTSNDFSLSSGGLVQGKVFRLFKDNTLLTHGSLSNVSGVHLPSGGTFVFKDIYVEIPLTALGQQVMNLLGGFDGIKDIFSGNMKEKINAIDWKKFLQSLRYEVDIEAFGNVFTFKGTIN